MYEFGKYGMLVEWVVMRTGAEVTVGMVRFAVY
jgi:hypothetical protein